MKNYVKCFVYKRGPDFNDALINGLGQQNVSYLQGALLPQLRNIIVLISGKLLQFNSNCYSNAFWTNTGARSRWCQTMSKLRDRRVSGTQIQ